MSPARAFHPGVLREAERALLAGGSQAPSVPCTRGGAPLLLACGGSEAEGRPWFAQEMGLFVVEAAVLDAGRLAEAGAGQESLVEERTAHRMGYRATEARLEARLLPPARLVEEPVPPRRASGALRRLLETSLPHLPVMSYSEVDPLVGVRTLGSSPRNR